MTSVGDLCADCRCVLRQDDDANWSIWQDSVYCDHCLLDRVRAGEQVPGPAWVDPHGKTRHLFYVVCSRCNGTGMYLVSATQIGTDCIRCLGNGWIDPDREETQRAGRWSATYQSNRQPPRKQE